MTITIVAILITAIAIYLDTKTLFRHRAFPPVALAGVLTVIASFVL